MTMNKASRFIPWIALSAAAALLAGTAPAMAQSGGGKETQKLQKKVEESRQSLQGAVDQIKATMTQYNAMFAEGGKGPESVYKELPKSIDKSDEAAQEARKSVESLRKELDAFYKSWEKEIASYTSPSMKERSQKSLDRVKSTYDRFNTALQGAAELYQPFIASLRDQSMFMGRDLSPAAIGELKPEADKLNQDAGALYTKVDEAIAATKPGAADAAAEETGEAAGDDAGAEEETGGEEQPGGE